MLNEMLRRFKILPAVTFDSAEDAEELGQIFSSEGLGIIEIPYRTEAASDAIRVITKKCPNLFTGAGSILTIEQLHDAIDAGAVFGLSPGFNKTIVAEAAKLNFPFIPGIMTPSEMETAFSMGCHIQKLFPASQVGGPAFLRSLIAPYGKLSVQFIPMGGVNIDNMKDYLLLGNVIAIGGSWLASPKLLADKNFHQIRTNVNEALKAAAIR